MELSPIGRRRRDGRHVLVTCLAVLFGWLLLVTVVPGVLGLRTEVGGDDATGLDRGAFTVARSEPAADVRVGDRVVSAPRSEPPVRLVTSTPVGWLVTATDDGATFPVSTAGNPTADVVVVSVPLVGLPLAPFGPLARWLLLTVVGALLLAAQLTRRPPSVRLVAVITEAPCASSV